MLRLQRRRTNVKKKTSHFQSKELQHAFSELRIAARHKYVGKLGLQFDTKHPILFSVCNKHESDSTLLLQLAFEVMTHAHDEPTKRR
jgi:hypothetical protein